ncbi:glycoside hydrolase family 29 protein [Atractiella rhizophila]|nr:glycoside hydrolase family 29 protein [Atractiella rhizophila]
MFTFGHHLDNSKTLTGILLPNQTGGSQLTGTVNIHMFAATLISSDISNHSNGPVLHVQNVRSTTKFRLHGKEKAQLVELTITNLAPSNNSADRWIVNPTSFTLSHPNIKTVIPGSLKRLRGGDQVRVIVGIVSNGVKAGKTLDGVTILANEKKISKNWKITAGIPDYYVGDDSLKTHESAEWFDSAKFGLFVHWGIYSVPAWTVSGTQYAEWYWYWQHNPANSSSAVWTHHREVYGEDFLYDDFFPHFTASEFNAKDFVDFVSDIGAKYYVNHDGFSLFDTTGNSNRNSLNYGPKRDLLGEIVDATKKYRPDIKIGTYFSLPEWFNPSFAKYGHAGGGLAHNAYNNSELEPYTGYVKVDDFLEDIMKPQMEALFYKYNTDILWCDVGGPTVYPEIAPKWYNWAAKQGRQVLANARCGANYSDFDNPEYSATTHLKTRKWESSEGSDPYSYGYNRDTPDANYRNATYVLHSLVDIVSKGGNYLIDVGPTANGTVVPPSKNSLLKVGSWLKFAGEAIYDTQWWFYASQDEDLRFTTKEDAFYITSLTYPVNGTIRTKLPVPAKKGDKVTFLGPTKNQTALQWQWTPDGTFEVFGNEEELSEVDDAWAFKIEYV